jgi:hypothetical protein
VEALYAREGAEAESGVKGEIRKAEGKRVHGLVPRPPKLHGDHLGLDARSIQEYVKKLSHIT